MATKTYSGALNFKHVDKLMGRFEMGAGKKSKGIMSKRELVVDPGFFPDDFEVAEYDVTGSYKFTVEINKKKNS